MPKTIKNAIETEIRADDKFSRTVGRMSRGMERLNRIAGRAKAGLRAVGRSALFAGKVLSTSLKIGATAAVGAFGLVTAAVWKLSSAFSQIEDAQAQFTPLMGSAQRAKELVDALNKTAATTPFQFETLSDTAKQLLPSMNGNIERTIELTRMLGDTAGGNAQKLESITRGYNKALLKGKVDLEALNMIAEAGVPIFQQLGDVTGRSGEQLFSAISNGEVSVEQLTATFKKMTSQGGIFFGGMEIASQTLTGKISTLKDNVMLAMASFGSALAPTLKLAAERATEVAQRISAWAEANQEMIKQKFELYVRKVVDVVKDMYRWVVDNKDEIKKFGSELLSVGKTIFQITKWIWKNKESVLALVVAYKSLNVSLGLVDWAGFSKKGVDAIGGIEGKTKGLSKMLGKGGILFASFSAGWAVGSAIFEQWNSAMDDLLVRTSNTASKIGMTVHKMDNVQLQSQLDKLKSDKENKFGKWTYFKSLVTGNLDEYKAAIATNNQAQADIMNEQTKRMRDYSMKLKAYVQGNGPMPTAFEQQRLPVSASAYEDNVPPGGDVSLSAQPHMPQAQSARMESVKTERVELTIKDENNRAEIKKKPTSRGLDIVRFGGPLPAYSD